MEPLSHYDVLGVKPDSTDNEVKKAYHRIARVHHPDKAGNGDVEVFKRATIAYEALSDKKRRQEYDVQLFATIGKQNNNPWYSPDPASRAAAAAFKNTNESKDSTAFSEDKSYRKRPQQTRFSQRYHESSSTPHSASSSPYTNTSNSRYSHMNSENTNASSVPKNSKYRREGETDFVDLTDPEPPLNNTAKSRPPNPSPDDPSEGTKSGKRSAGDDDPPVESPSKRLRVFDFSGLKNTPPFTEKHGTTFSFGAVNDAINESIFDGSQSSSARAAGSARTRQYNRRSRYAEEEKAKKIERLFSRSRMLLNQYTSESLVGYDELFKMHNQRVEMTAQSVVDPQSVLKSFQDTERILELLLAGTREFINQIS